MVAPMRSFFMFCHFLSLAVADGSSPWRYEEQG
jgi:hypothetical protein